MSIYNNTAIFKGNLGKPAEIKETKAGTVAKFNLAVYRSGKGQEAITDWISCVAWHDLARGLENIEKGTKLIVVGSVVTRNYKADDGTTKYVTEILARDIGEDIAISKDRDEEDPF